MAYRTAMSELHDALRKGSVLRDHRDLPIAPASSAREEIPADRLNELGVLTRREIEARVVGPLLEALEEEFGRERVLAVAREVIIRLARDQGAQLAKAMAGESLADFARTLEYWKKGDALEIDVVEETDEAFSFNVTRCRYAELYRSLGIPELGALLSCNRDYALIEGFNPDVTLTRTQTIMQGAPFCDFRYRRKQRVRAPEPSEGSDSPS